MSTGGKPRLCLQKPAACVEACGPNGSAVPGRQLTNVGLAAAMAASSGLWPPAVPRLWRGVWPDARGASRAPTGPLDRELTDTPAEHRSLAPSASWAGRDGEGRSGSKGGKGQRGGAIGVRAGGGAFSSAPPPPRPRHKFTTTHKPAPPPPPTAPPPPSPTPKPPLGRRPSAWH